MQVVLKVAAPSGHTGHKAMLPGVNRALELGLNGQGAERFVARDRGGPKAPRSPSVLAGERVSSRRCGWALRRERGR